MNSGGKDFVLLYAYNGTGKTRVSMVFKDSVKRKNGGNPDTLYSTLIPKICSPGTTTLKATAGGCCVSIRHHDCSQASGS